MGEKLYAQFEACLSTLISEKGSVFDNLPLPQQKYVENRIKRYLELFKKEHES